MEGKARLLSTYGENIDRKCPLSEYPRPQFRRDSYICLNGEWEYSILPQGEVPHGYQGTILVPFAPESILSGVERVLQPGETLFYRRTFTIPEGFNKGRVLLHFGAVDYLCKVCVNGIHVAEHRGGYIPFEVDITSALKEENELTLAVTDPTNTGVQARGKQKLEHGGIFYTPSSGIWQTVWLESVPENHIKSVKYTPDIDSGSIKIEATCNAPMDVNFQIFDGAKVIAEGVLIGGIGSVKLEEVKLWSPEYPHLYGIKLFTESDTINSYFGMRKFGIIKDKKGHNRIMLNNKPYFHNGLLDQGYYSDGLYTPPSEEAMLNDLKTIKAMGFNMLRKHIKIEPLRWYYLCDKLGILVWQDMVNGGGKCNTPWSGICGFLGLRVKDNHYFFTNRKDEEGRREFYLDTEATVKHLYNVVSLSVWVPFNESWGQFDALKVTDFVRCLDNTRPIDHASGWHDQGGGDFNSMHIYFKPIALPKKKEPKRSVILSEFGGYSWDVEGHVYNPAKTFGYKKYHSQQEFQNALIKLYETEIIPLIPEGLSAAVYTQVSDVEEEINGLITYDRKVVKIKPEVMAEINKKVKYNV